MLRFCFRQILPAIFLILTSHKVETVFSLIASWTSSFILLPWTQCSGLWSGMNLYIYIFISLDFLADSCLAPASLPFGALLWSQWCLPPKDKLGRLVQATWSHAGVSKNKPSSQWWPRSVSTRSWFWQLHLDFSPRIQSLLCSWIP